MEVTEPSRQPWPDLPAILVLAFLGVVATFVVWKRAESVSREQFLTTLEDDTLGMWSVDTEIGYCPGIVLLIAAPN